MTTCHMKTCYAALPPMSHGNMSLVIMWVRHLMSHESMPHEIMWVCHLMSHGHTSHEIMRVCRLMSHQNMSHNQRQTGSGQQFCMSSARRFCVRTWGPYGGALPSAASGGRHAALQCGHGARREARGRAPSPGAHLELRHLRRSALQPSHRGLPPLPRLWRARPCGTGGLDISAR